MIEPQRTYGSSEQSDPRFMKMQGTGIWLHILIMQTHDFGCKV